MAPRHGTLVDFIREHREDPFFLYVPFNAVHWPLQAPDRIRSRFPQVDDPIRQTYYAMLSFLDDAVGRILDTLAEEELETRMLVILLNDNGAPRHTRVKSNAPHRAGKASLFEDGVRVPIVVRWPGVTAAGVEFDGIVSALDLFPTVCAAAGLELPDELALDGVDLAPFLRGEKPENPHDILCWRLGEVHAVRSGSWKLVAEPPTVSLCDLARDPGETTDVASRHADVVARMQERFAQSEAGVRAPAWTPIGADPESPGDEVLGD